MASSVLGSSPYACSGSNNRKLCLIVTGASRGLGRAIAVTFCQSLILLQQQQKQKQQLKVHAILVARSAAGLQETAAQILQLETAAVNNNNNNNSNNSNGTRITVTQVVADLGDLTTLDATLDEILEHCCCNNMSDDAEKQEDDDTGVDANNTVTTTTTTTSSAACAAADQVYFVNNAGSLGHLGLCSDSPSLRDMQATVDLNVTGALWASVRVARWAVAQQQAAAQQQQQQQGSNSSIDAVPPDTTATATATAKVTIVNISSLVAVQPFATMAVYSAGKAARDSYHTAMATETATAATSSTANVVRILNYAPGPLETDMATELRQADALDATLKPHFCNKQLVDPMDSAAALVKLLLTKNTFESGSHVDYYDLS